MSKSKLHDRAHSVVHRSKHRTRLRVPKRYRKRANLQEVKAELEKIPEIKSVEVNSDTGSVLIHHEETPNLLDKISEAIDDAAPELLACMLIPGAGEAEVGMGVVTKLFQTLFDGSHHPANGNGGTAAASHAPPAGLEGAPPATKYLPAAFILAGAWKLFQEEALLAGLAPLALFYYGFDMYWKIRQEERTAYLEQRSNPQQHRTDSTKMPPSAQETH